MDFVSDFVSRIKVGTQNKKEKVIVRKNRLTIEIANLLCNLGYISAVVVQSKTICVYLKYSGGVGSLGLISVCSKGSRSMYIRSKSYRFKPKLGETYIVSTVKGLMVYNEAVRKGLGGKLILVF